jgi:predicted dinucleotide-binding enzyme
MKIGILGSGDVAKTLALGFVRHNHNVMVGSRTPIKLSDWQKEQPKLLLGNFAEAAAHGEIIVIAIKGEHAADALRLAGVDNLAGKTVIDASNPIANEPPTNGVLKFFTNMNESLMEQLQKEFPKANFVKAFNSVGSVSMVNPNFKTEKPTMFICGNNEAAKQAVSSILVQFGWEPADMGKVESARAIEPLCMLWCIPGFLYNQWTHAFRLLK